MSEEIPYNKRYIYNLDQSILNGLETLYFDTLTFEPKSKDEFMERRNDELVGEKANIPNPDVFVQPTVVQPKPRNISGLVSTLSNLKISNPSNNGITEDQASKSSDNNEDANENQSETESESESENEAEKLKPIQEQEQVDEEYESSISFMTTKLPMVLFKSPLLKSDECLGVYKTSINAIDSPNFDPLDMLRQISFNPRSNPIPKDPLAAGMSAIFMMASGHFAGAIISHLPHSTKGNKGSQNELQLQSVRMLAQKTFHRYTTRRKQGGSQSAMDDSKGKANSAGSTLRRYNEQALGKDIEGLLEEWKPLLDECTSIFIRGSGKGGKHARGTGLIVRDPKDPKAIIKTGDKRVKMIPFGTKRPTVMELKSAWCELTYLKVVEVPSIEKSEIEKRKKRDAMIIKSKESTKVEDKEYDEKVKLTAEVVGILKKSKAPALVLFMRKNKAKFDVNFTMQPEEQYKMTPTLLHYASKKGMPFMVQTLMVQLKADPTIVNLIDKTAYEVAADKETRYSFRLARHLLGEDCGINWELSHILEGMSKEEFDAAKLKMKQEEEEKVKLESEEIRQEHESIVDAIKIKEESKTVKTNLLTGPGMQRVSEEQKLSGLSDMQKMKLLREQRFRAIEARMAKQKGEQN